MAHYFTNEENLKSEIENLSLCRELYRSALA